MTRTSNPFAVLAILAGSAALLAVAPAAANDGTDASVFDVKVDKDFAEFRKPLASFLRSRHAKAPTSVCILGERHADGTKSAWVIWRGGHTMLLWDGGTSAMVASRRILDLSHDVVASEDDVAGSTYLVTRAWVTRQTQRCRQLGTTILFTKRGDFTPPENKQGDPHDPAARS